MEHWGFWARAMVIVLVAWATCVALLMAMVRVAMLGAALTSLAARSVRV
jgi:hypothetical protein